MQLYYCPGACSLAPHIILREGNFRFDLERVDLKTKKTEKGADFLVVNPNGYVPVLQRDDGVIMTEAAVILQYLADHAEGQALIPKCGSLERYDVQSWINFVSTELHKGFSPLFKPDTPDTYKIIIKDNLKKRFEFLDKHLAKHEFLYGDHFTVADAYFFTVMRWANYVALDIGAFSNLKNYLTRIESRPKVQETLAAEAKVG